MNNGNRTKQVTFNAVMTNAAAVNTMVDRLHTDDLELFIVAGRRIVMHLASVHVYYMTF